MDDQTDGWTEIRMVGSLNGPLRMKTNNKLGSEREGWMDGQLRIKTNEQMDS